MDFFARDPAGDARLIQACADSSDSETRERDARALVSAAKQHKEATPPLLTFDTLPPQPALPAPLRWQPAIGWLVGEKLPAKHRRH